MARSVFTLSPGSLPSPEVRRDRGSLAEIVPRGRVVELSGEVAQGRLTLAARFVAHTQRGDELAAWVQPRDGGLFPPDLARVGVDLDALMVIHTPREHGPNAVARAAELLLRSGGFGLVVLDLTLAMPRGEPWIQRLGGLARRHGARVVLLTSQRAEHSSAGALVAVRVELRRSLTAGLYTLAPSFLRDRCDLAHVALSTRHRAPWEIAP